MCYRMNPNSDHSMFPHWFRIYDTALSWFMIIVNVSRCVTAVITRDVISVCMLSCDVAISYAYYFLMSLNGLPAIT